MTDRTTETIIVYSLSIKPGDKVVCINDQWSGKGRQSRLGIPCPLSSWSVYTVSALGIESCFRPDGAWGRWVTVKLMEVDHPAGGGFNITRFRPVQTKSTETGMAILKRILNSAPVREDA